MHCRQTYQVNKRELNKAAQRDQSYRNCLGALLIFFFLCLILILACIQPWKTQSQKVKGNNEYGKQESQYRDYKEEPTKGPETTGIIRSTITTEINNDIIEETAPTKKTFETDDENNFTEIPKHNPRQPEKDKGAIVEDTTVTSQQVTDYIETVSPSGPVAVDKYSSGEYFNSKSELDITTHDITASTSSTRVTEDATANSTGGYVKSKVKDATRNVTSLPTRRTEEATTDTSGDYYTSVKSEPDTTIRDIVTSTSSIRLTGLAPNTTADSSSQYVTSEVKDATGDIASSTLTTRDIEEATTDQYSSDDYYTSEKSELDTTIRDIVISTSSTRLTGLAQNTTANSSSQYVTLEVKGATGDVTSTLSTRDAEEATTDQYSSDDYYTSEKSEFDTASDNITTLTSSSSSIQSTSLAENVTADSTSGYATSEANVTTYNVTFSTLPTRLDDLEENSTETFTHERYSGADVVTDVTSSTMNYSTDFEESTNAEYSSDGYHSQESQPIAAIIYRTTKITTPTTTRFDFQEDEHTKYSTEEYLRREDKFTTTGYNETLTDNDVTKRSTFVTENYNLSEKSFPATTETINEAEDTTNVTSSARSQVKTAETHNEKVTVVTSEKPSMYNYASTTSEILITSSVSHNNTTTMVSPLPDEDKDVCTTEHCKRSASKMLSYMNHLADPCDDFYEYACGGFEANPQLVDGDSVRQSRNYQRIARQMAKEKHENVHSTFRIYYDSCVQYERTVNFNERVEMAINALKDVGQFYINATWSNNHTDFTNLFAQLILHHSAFLFDVVPKFDEHRPTNFTLQISLPKYESPFMTGHVDDLCLEDEFETEKQYVNLDDLYNNYKKCKKNTEEFLRSVKEALTIFSVFRGLNDSHLTWDLQSQYIEKTIHDIDFIIMQGYFSYFPSKDKIQEAYALDPYDKITLEGLQIKNMFINWKQLIHSLIGADMMEANSINNNGLHIYLYNPLMQGLSKLQEFADKDPMSLNNVIMALYAHKLYSELVLSRRNDIKDHCLEVATNLLQLEASSLYISSFTNQEIRKMNELIENSFNDLKRTLRNKTENIEWTNENGRKDLLDKIDSLKLSLPAFSYYKDRDSLYKNYNMPQITLYNNYFNNSMILLKRYRTLLYAVLKKQVGEERQVWTHYATPFQAQARVIFSLNLVVIPYGIIDWSSINEAHTLNYILLATLGNLVAHQIAHYFDTNGLYSWELSKKNIMYEDDMTDMNLDDYINCHKDHLYQAPVNFTLPLTEQTVSLTIPRLTLNERLSDIVGFRLAYDTLALTRSDAEKRLPWIKLRIEQLFYLAYVQMYCTKSPLTSSYVSLYESEDLPNRIRVFVSVSNNKFVADEWNCPMGSQVAPNNVCSVFPYIDFKETTQALM